MKKIPVAILILAPIFVFSSCATTVMPGLDKQMRSLTIAAVGDISHSVGYSYSEQSFQLGRNKYAHVRHIISEADLSFANLEAPFTMNEPVIQKRFPFSSPPQELDHVCWSGFNLFSLANNHTADAGYAGVKDTMVHLERLEREYRGKKQLIWAGAGRSAAEARRMKVFTHPGFSRRIVFMAYGNNSSQYVNTFEIERAAREIESARRRYPDAIILVSVHYGTEYVHVPPPDIIVMYRRLVESGASIVFGHHPHVVQGIEEYRDGLIFYSLGNFAFTSMTNRHKAAGAYLYGMIAGLNLQPAGDHFRVTMTVIPLYVDNSYPMTVSGQTLQPRSFQPFVPDPPFSTKILASIADWSHQIPGNDIIFEFGDGYMRSRFNTALGTR